MITVGHCGFDSKHRMHLEMRRPCGTPDYTLLLVKTRAFFVIKGERILTMPGTVILYDKTNRSITAAPDLFIMMTGSISCRMKQTFLFCWDWKFLLIRPIPFLTWHSCRNMHG